MVNVPGGKWIEGKLWNIDTVDGSIGDGYSDDFWRGSGNENRKGELSLLLFYLIQMYQKLLSC